MVRYGLRYRGIIEFKNIQNVKHMEWSSNLYGTVSEAIEAREKVEARVKPLAHCISCCYIWDEILEQKLDV